MSNQLPSELAKGMVFHAPLSEDSLVAGAELVTNGGFDSATTGWTAGNSASLSIDSSSLKTTNGDANYGYAYQVVTTVSGKTYTISAKVKKGTCNVSFSVGTVAQGTQYGTSGTITSTDFTPISISFTATGTSTYITLQNESATVSQYGYFDSVSVREQNYGYIDNVSRSIGTQTACYPVSDRQGSGANRAYQFDGVNDYVELNSSSTYDFTQPFTIITRTNRVAGTHNDLYSRGNASSYFHIYWSTDNTITAIVQSGVWQCYTGAITNTGEVSVGVIVTPSTNSCAIYINGVVVSSTTIGSITGNLGLGFPDYLNRHINSYGTGSISMCRIFNYAVSATPDGRADGLSPLQRYSKPEYPIEWVDRISGTIGANLISSTITNGDFTTFSGASASGFTAASASGGYATTADELVYYIGKYYNVNYSLTVNSGSTPRYSFFDTTGGSGQDAAWITMTAGGKSDRVLITNSATANTGCLFFQTLSASNFVVSGLSITQAGCVLDLNSSGLSRASDGSYNTGYWTDRTNQNSAQVVGATSVIPPASNLNASWFNGASSVVSFADQPQYTLPSLSFSVNIWMYPFQLSERSFFSKDLNNSNAEYNMYILPTGGLRIYLLSSGGVSNYSYFSTSNSIISINNWYSVGFSYNGSIGIFYINGVKYTATRSDVGTGFTSFSNTSAPLELGKESRGSIYSNVLLSNCILYNTVKSDDEFKLLYDLGH